MSLDEALLAEMALQKESPDDPRQRKFPKPVYAKSKFTVAQLTEFLGDDKVWVKCITEAKPWANEKPMNFWQDYLIPIHEAIALDERRFCVILVNVEEEKPEEAPVEKPAPKLVRKSTKGER